jgi:hypothetical protein
MDDHSAGLGAGTNRSFRTDAGETARGINGVPTLRETDAGGRPVAVLRYQTEICNGRQILMIIACTMGAPTRTCWPNVRKMIKQIEH